MDIVFKIGKFKWLDSKKLAQVKTHSFGLAIKIIQFPQVTTNSELELIVFKTILFNVLAK
jgi:hypothetical protein